MRKKLSWRKKYIKDYEEESKGLDGPRRYLQGGPRVVT